MAEGMEAGMCYCDYDSFPEFFHSSTRRARKQHECCECREQIMPGEAYQRCVGKWDGIFSEYKTCLPCSRIRQDFCAPFEMLVETLWDALGFNYLDGESRFYDEEERGA